VTAILLDRKFLDLVRSGRKRTTVRKGKRLYPKGRAVLRSGSEETTINVRAVRHCSLRDLTDDDARLDGFSSRTALVRTLESFYPDLTEDDQVTVVTFDRARAEP